jgi:adenosylmethionine-8-amino-7-oxononanoate aminotransferase
VTISYPDGHVFYRRLRYAYPRIVHAQGCWLEDDAGHRYLDACAGAFVVSLGHGDGTIADAMAEQARRVAYVSGRAFTHDAVEELASELAVHTPGDLDRLYFLTSGSDAIEAALKLARQYHVERGESTRHTIIALSPSYHGNTLLALAASAREHYRAYFGDWLTRVVRIPAPYPYRCDCGGVDDDCPRCSGGALEEAILREGAETIAAFIAEPVGGSSTGASVARPGYYRRVREICDRYGVLLIADEVLCGAGRTGRWWAIEHHGVIPDVLVMGKGIASGYAPLSALAAPRRIVDVLAQGSGALLHAQTYSHHAVSCAAGLATVRALASRRLVERSASAGARFQDRLRALRALPQVGDVRGIGLLAGVELVADVATHAPFPRSLRVAETFADQALEHGLVVWPNVGQAAGHDGDLLMLAPPFIVTDDEMDEIVRRFADSLHATLAVLPGARAASRGMT